MFCGLWGGFGQTGQRGGGLPIWPRRDGCWPGEEALGKDPKKLAGAKTLDLQKEKGFPSTRKTRRWGDYKSYPKIVFGEALTL